MVVLVVGVVAMYVGYEYYHYHKITTYNSSVTIQISLQPSSTGNSSNADDLTVAEALADTFASGPIVTSYEFGKDVSDQIGQDMSVIVQRYGANPDLGNWQDGGLIAGSLSASRDHNLVTLAVNWSTASGAWAIANALGEVATTKLGTFLDYNHSVVTPSTLPVVNAPQPAVAVYVISFATNPSAVSGLSTSKETLLIGLLAVALILGLALAFLLDYLDDQIRRRDQVAHLLELPVLGEVPRMPVPGRR